MAVDITTVMGLDDFIGPMLEAEGRPLLYFRRYTRSNNPYGECPDCVDNLGKAITNSKCTICWGTGFKGGYSPPITGYNSPYGQVYALFTKDKVVSDFQPVGVQTIEQEQVVYIRLGLRPTVSDLIVDPWDGSVVDNGIEGDVGFSSIRYKVGNAISNWSFNQQQIGYIITVMQLTDSDPIYQFPLPTLPNVSGTTNTSLTQIRTYQPYKTKTITSPSH